MITSEDSEYTYEFKDHYRIIPMIKDFKYKINKGKLVKRGFEYISNTNSNWINDKDLRLWLKEKNISKPLKYLFVNKKFNKYETN